MLAPSLVPRGRFFCSTLALKDEWAPVDAPYFSAPGDLSIICCACTMFGSHSVLRGKAASQQLLILPVTRAQRSRLILSRGFVKAYLKKTFFQFCMYFFKKKFFLKKYMQN